MSTGTPTLLVAALTDVGRLRTENQDTQWADADAGIAIVCDGMGGHRAGEVASNLAVKVVRDRWTASDVEQARATWIRTGTPQARRELIALLRDGVMTANQAIIERSAADQDKRGMGTTFTGAMFVGGEVLIAHAGDSRAYLVRDGIAMRITEDHTLLARLAEAGVDTSLEPQRWKGVVTNALGIGEPTWIASAAVPLADGDRFLFCTDGVSEYFEEAELGELLVQVPSPARAAQRLIELALERGGHDNATVVVVKVVEAGTTPLTAEARRQDQEALARCPLLADLSPQRRLRVLRVASEHTIHDGEPVPARFLGDRVSWIVVAGEVARGRVVGGPGALLYPECLAASAGATLHPPHEWIARGELRALALRADDVDELSTDEPDVGEKLYAALAALPR